MRPRDWRVRTKLIVVLVVPALAFVAVAGLLTSVSVRQAVALGETADQVALGRQVAALVHDVQFERDWAVGRVAALGGREVSREDLAGELAAARESVDTSAAVFVEAAGPLRGRPGLAARLDEAIAALEELAVVRAGTDDGWLHQEAVFDGYSRAIGALLALLEPPTEAQEPTRGVRELAEAKELRSQVRGQVHAVTSAGRFTGQADELRDTGAQQRAALDRFRAVADPQQAARYDGVVRGQAVAATARLEASVLEQTDAEALRGVDADRWWSAASTELELVREVEVALLAEVLASVEQARDDQWRQTALVTAGALIILALSLLISVGIGRSIGSALRLLHEQAMTVAQVRLPELLRRLRKQTTALPSVDDVEPIAAGGADEVGDVANAFTEVHRAAVGLAAAQAQMRRNVSTIYQHLARRSQVLVERQLELLDDLERDEAEPKRLESLFQLDHLATRQRRNNESLLVLANADTARRYDQPIPLHAVVVAAIAEIERYQRVRDDVTGEIHVVGHAVADLVHLLAELLDNATAFSDPESTVTVYGHAGAYGAEITITDSGIGMSSDALAEANDVLADPPLIDVAASERMGLVVVGHLAARHRVTVRLTDMGPGTRATVWLPSQLLTGPATALPVPDPHQSEPDQPTHPRAHRPPVRAEDVLGPAEAPRQAGNVWWARPEQLAAAASPASWQPRTRAAAPPAPPLVPQATRTSASGLPVRVPQAQLPAGLGGETPTRAAVTDQDPEEVGGTLAALYGGVARAESELGGDAPTEEIAIVRKDRSDEP